MELVFINHGNVFDIHYFSTLASVVIVVGGLYGALRLIFDLGRGVMRLCRAAMNSGAMKWVPPSDLLERKDHTDHG